MELRIKRDSVTFVSNDVIRRSGLSFGALGLFAYLLSLGGGDSVDDQVLRSHGDCSSPELERYKSELRRAGLLVRRHDGNEDVFDDPQVVA